MKKHKKASLSFTFASKLSALIGRGLPLFSAGRGLPLFSAGRGLLTATRTFLVVCFKLTPRGLLPFSAPRGLPVFAPLGLLPFSTGLGLPAFAGLGLLTQTRTFPAMCFKFLAKSFILFCCAVLLFILSVWSDVFAANLNNPYIVREVFVSKRGASATKARSMAIADAQRQAFATLLERIKIAEPAVVENLSDDDIAQMVQSVQIRDEKVALRNYSANIDVEFNRQFVKFFFQKGSSSPLRKKRRYLVIPIMRSQGNFYLWEKRNNWKLAWEGQLENEVSRENFAVPEGNFDDISLLDARVSAEARYSDHKEIIEKYQMGSAVIAIAHYNKMAGKMDVELKIIQKFRKRGTRLVFTNLNGLSDRDFINHVALKTAYYILDSDVAAKKGGGNKAKDNVITVHIPISNLREWLRIRGVIEDLEFIDSMNIRAISKKFAAIEMSYNIESHMLSHEFAKSGLSLDSSGKINYLRVDEISGLRPVSKQSVSN